MSMMVTLSAVVIVLVIFMIANAILWIALGAKTKTILKQRRMITENRDVIKGLRKMAALADIDKLTEAVSRRKGEEMLDVFLALLPEVDNETGNFRRKQGAISTGLGVFFIDADKFKSVNDTFGHAKGDEVLVGIVTAIKSCLRDSDVVCRLGGDEFLVLMPGIPWHILQRRADALNQAVAAIDFGIGYPVTLSIGATYVTQCVSKDFVLERADKALYSAKEAGRNRSSYT